MRPIFEALAPLLTSDTEFSVELHPLDVTDDLLAQLRDGGVNRISMGVQSLDDATLAAMRRGYTTAEAAKAFARVKKVFDNAGTDFIIGFPGDPCTGFQQISDWGQTHVSVYSLQNERNLENVPDDDWVMDRLRETSTFLATIGLKRYEISNYAKPGFECRHNQAVWRGEDYLGLGEGAFGRIGRLRTKNLGDKPLGSWGQAPNGWGQTPTSPGDRPCGGWGQTPTEVEEVTAEQDALERRIFRLRTSEGLDAHGHPEWGQALAAHCRNGLLVKDGDIYRLTARGAEVCDSILVDLVAPSR